MSAAPIQPGQIRAIHAIKTRVRLDEGSYRAMLQGFGVATSKDLSRDDAERMLARLRDIPGASKPVEAAAKRPSKDRADGPKAAKLRAMWIALWNLGAVEDRRDSALHAFIERQTGKPHSRFILHAGDAAAVIEALKHMLERAGVAFPTQTGDAGLDLMAAKRAILRAQWRRGLARGVLRELPGLDEDTALASYVAAVTRGGARRLATIDCPSLTAAEADEASAALGRKIRGVQVRLRVRRAAS